MTNFKYFLFSLFLTLPIADAHAECSLGKDSGYNAVKIGDTIMSHHISLDDALATFAKLRNAGACDPYQGCSLGKDSGYNAVKIGDTVMSHHISLDDALAALRKLREGGACGSLFSSDRCVLRHSGRGVSVYTQGGARLIGTYRTMGIAEIVRSALVSAEACR